MTSVFKILLGIIVVVLAGLWLHHEFIASENRSHITLQTVQVNPQNVSLKSHDGYAELTGTAIMDSSEGLPAVPYIKYMDTGSKSVKTKQLIFADARGCLPNAGDAPCVPTYAFQSAYPKLYTGEPISIKGYIDEDRFIVTSLSTS